MIPMETLMENKVMPTMIPQINDPRIIVQTFNSPISPILPGTLPDPKLNLNVSLPSQTKAPPRDIIIEEHKLSKKYRKMNKYLKKELVKGFESINEDKDFKKVPKPQISLLNSTTKRISQLA